MSAYIEVPQELPASRKVRESPATFDDHFSQVGPFFRSLTTVEQDHVIQAYTFELGKCYEENIRIRQMQSLANIDARLCAEVAKGLGLPAPAPTVTAEESAASPTLSQVGGAWPVSGRIVGIVADESSDIGAIDSVRQGIHPAGMVPLVIAPKGGKLGGSVVVHRTYLTARSTEFDAILLAGASDPGSDAVDSRDAKAGDPAGHPSVDPRVSLMIAEAFRHSKALGGWGDAANALAAAGVPSTAAGVIIGNKASTVVDQLQVLLAKHRVWERFPAS